MQPRARGKKQPMGVDWKEKGKTRTKNKSQKRRFEAIHDTIQKRDDEKEANEHSASGTSTSKRANPTHRRRRAEAPEWAATDGTSPTSTSTGGRSCGAHGGRRSRPQSAPHSSPSDRVYWVAHISPFFFLCVCLCGEVQVPTPAVAPRVGRAIVRPVRAAIVSVEANE